MLSSRSKFDSLRAAFYFLFLTFIQRRVNLWDAERLRLHARMGDISRMLKEREECVSANNVRFLPSNSRSCSFI